MKVPMLVLSIVAAASFGLLALAGTGSADPNVPNIPPHQHFVVTAAGEWTPIGPQVCPAGSHPELQRAFNQFHVNIHHSENPPGTPIETNGPQGGAPGLHNGIGADMQGRPCGFVPPSAP
jgi:hypothetical protein